MVPKIEEPTSLVERDLFCSLPGELIDKKLQEILVIILIELDPAGLLKAQIKIGLSNAPTQQAFFGLVCLFIFFYQD